MANLDLNVCNNNNTNMLGLKIDEKKKNANYTLKTIWFSRPKSHML